jgi:hypothetical protein
MIKFQKRLWTGLVAMVLLSPIGILLPLIFRAESSWGEWDAHTLGKIIGYIPEGLRRDSGLFRAPMANYSLAGENGSLTTQMISYIISGFLGMLLSGLVICLIVRFWTGREK